MAPIAGDRASGQAMTVAAGRSDAIAPVDRHPRGAVDPDDIRGAFAANTQRAYRSDWLDWSEWARQRGIPSLPDAAVSPEHVAEYLKALAAQGRKYSTIARRVAAIAAAHQVAGLAFDRNAPAIDFALKRLARELGTAKRGKDALLTEDIVAILPKGGDLMAVRDRALVLLLFASALRRSEIVALDIADIEWKRDGAVLHIRRSKGDQAAAGQLVAVTYGRREATCPLRALKAWLAAARIEDGAIFRRVVGEKVGARLSGAAIYETIRRLAAAAGLDPSRFGAHSPRIGHATQYLDAGGDPLKVQAQLRHKKLDTTLSYNRAGAQLFKDNSSGKLGL
jgi:integrase